MVLSASIGALGSLAGGLIGAASSNSAAKKQFQYQSALQAQAAQLNYDYGIKSLKNSPSAQREGLTSAGYNPMLAVQNGTSGANAGWTTSGQAQNVDYAGDIASGISNVLNIQNMKNQTAQTESQIDLQHAQAQETRQRSLNEHLREPFIAPRERAELQRTNAIINNLQADSSLKEATIQNLKDRLELDRTLGFMGIDTKRYLGELQYNATTYSADKALEGVKLTNDQSGTNSNKSLAGDIAKTLVGAGLAVFVGNKIKLIKPIGDLIKVIPKNILIK